MKPIRPKFSNPPLVERAVTIVFEKVGLVLGDYGLFWSALRDDFPLSEAAAPIPCDIEQFDGFRPVQPQIKLMDDGTLPRALFRNPSKGELIQIQPDRFSFNWIKTGDDHSYPHSEAVLARFYELLSNFIDFLKERQLGSIIPVQCEITNVNVIPMSDVGDSFIDFATVLKFPELSTRDSLLKLESQVVGAKHLILDDSGAILGRVHSMAQPSLRIATNELAYRLDITARGAPIGSGLEGVERFFDKAVSAVNGVFLSSVTNSGRQFWGELHG